MRSYIKILFYSLVGLAAALAAWPVVEALLVMQTAFPTFLLFNITIGGVFGMIAGAVFGSGEGIILNDKSKMIRGIITGTLVGLAGGMIGFLLGQTTLFLIGSRLIVSMKDFNTKGLLISRAFGWILLGVFIGSIEGIRAKSVRKITAGLIGGLSGSLLAALFLEYSRIIMPDFTYRRIVAFIIFGLFIGLFYGLAEKSLSFGVLRLLNGKYKGKEFLINQRKIKIGCSAKNDIALIDYANIQDFHGLVYVKGGEVYLKHTSDTGRITINDEPIAEQRLKLEDVIKIGDAKFFYKFK